MKFNYHLSIVEEVCERRTKRSRDWEGLQCWAGIPNVVAKVEGEVLELGEHGKEAFKPDSDDTDITTGKAVAIGVGCGACGGECGGVNEVEEGEPGIGDRKGLEGGITDELEVAGDGGLKTQGARR